jgi:hypothetical protein
MPDIVLDEIGYSNGWVDSRWGGMQDENEAKFSETCSQVRTFSVSSKVVHSAPFKTIIVSLTDGPYLNPLTRRLGLKVRC